MCLLVNLKKEHTQNGTLAEDVAHEYQKKATKDMVVYKVLVREDGVFFSPYMQHIYVEGKLYKEEFKYADHITGHIGYTRLYNNLSVHNGIHLFSSIEAACKDLDYERDVVCEFTMPKGSIYFQVG